MRHAPSSFGRRLFIVGVTTPFFAPASSSEAAGIGGLRRLNARDEALRAVKEARKSLTSLRASFKQSRESARRLEPQTTAGELSILVPDALRWEVFRPERVVYWVNGKKVTAAGRDNKKVTPPTGGFGVVLPFLATLLAGDLGTLSDYEFTAAQELDGSVTIVAVPKEARTKQTVAKITLRTNAAKWGASNLRIQEAGGEIFSVEFAENDKNPALDPDRMKPPKGISR